MCIRDRNKIKWARSPTPELKEPLEAALWNLCVVLHVQVLHLMRMSMQFVLVERVDAYRMFAGMITGGGAIIYLLPPGDCTRGAVSLGR